MEDVRRGGGELGGRKQGKTKFSLFLNLSAVPKKSTPATNFEKQTRVHFKSDVLAAVAAVNASKLPFQRN